MNPGLILVGVLLSAFAAALPTAGWAALVWWCDRYEREPLPLVMGSFLWGALPAVAVSLLVEFVVGEPILGMHGKMTGEVLTGSGLVPVVEELSKGAALLLILLFWRSEIDDVMDGILYGAMIGFGFAMTENLFYFAATWVQDGWEAWAATVFLRSVIFGLNHAFFTAFAGAGLGYSRVAATRFGRYGVPVLGLGAAMAAHGVHNLGATLASVSAINILLSLVSDAGGVLLVVFMIWLSLRRERQWLRTELAGEVGRLLSGEDYVRLLSLQGRWAMLLRARRAGGMHAMRAVGRFQQNATELAFRKHRARVRGLDSELSRQIVDLNSRLSSYSQTAILT